jgi:cytoskeletal protein RodZ
MKKYNELAVLLAIIIVAVLLAGYMYSQTNRIQTIPYHTAPSNGEANSSDGTAATATSPSVSSASNSNTSGSSAVIQPTISSTAGTNSQLAELIKLKIFSPCLLDFFVGYKRSHWHKKKIGQRLHMRFI